MLKFITHISLTFILSLVLCHTPLLGSKAYAGMITTTEVVTSLSAERANVKRLYSSSGR